VLSIVLPPVAVLTTGRWVQAILNLVLTILGWVPGVIHALFICQDYYADRRTNRLVDAMRATRAG
jgi:uncharacterized membrane protein YqaE (UPF0057 family)